jgi:CheY-like chemotaxis protein
LQQAILNLLSNAIKFTPSGGHVKIRLSVINNNEQKTTNRYVQVEVSDTGIGIAADFLPHVFDRFCQADSTSSRSSKGLGLGLALAHHIVKLHGGTIGVESPGIGQGATFRVTLPIWEKAGEAKKNPKTEESIISLTGFQVLVVDDDADAQRWMSVVLEECGAEVMAVGSVSDALKIFIRQKPDVLISDIGMPGEDGYALIRKIRELEPMLGGRIPAVALTAYARVEDYQKSLAEGFQLHIAKPVRAAELIAVVASLVKRDG